MSAAHRTRARSAPRPYVSWIVIRPSEVEGEWVSHVLEFDVISQGRSVDHALDMAFEAAVMVLDDDAKAGRDPLERRAPRRYFDELYGMMSHGQPVTRDEMRAKKTTDGVVILVEVLFPVKAQAVVKAAGQPRARDREVALWEAQAPAQAC